MKKDDNRRRSLLTIMPVVENILSDGTDVYLVLINILLLDQNDLETVLNFRTTIWKDQYFAYLFI